MPIVKRKSDTTTKTEDKTRHIGVGEERLKVLQQRIAQTQVEKIAIGDIKPSPRRARKHPESQITKLMANMGQFGFHTAIVIDEKNQIIAGHARREAANRAGLSVVPVIRLNYLTEAEKRAVALADNKLGELSEFDPVILAQELNFLFNSEIDLGFDPQITGFETVEVDRILTAGGAAQSDPADDVLGNRSGLATSRRGDVWQCGVHRLICGDALDSEDYAALLGGEEADICFTDPPYNVPNAGHVTKRPGVREFAMAAGEMDNAQFGEFLGAVFARVVRNVRDGAVIFTCMDWRHYPILCEAAQTYLGPPKNCIVWKKANGGQGSFYRSQHEFIAVWVAGHASPTNNFKLGATGRWRSNVWEYPGFNSFGRERDQALAMHPTVKPVALVADALMDCSHRGDVVLDPFGGSGTTMIAAERTGRKARLIELDPLYCDVIVGRWQTFTGKSAVLAGTRDTFDDISASRKAAAPVGGDDVEA